MKLIFSPWRTASGRGILIFGSLCMIYYSTCAVVQLGTVLYYDTTLYTFLQYLYYVKKSQLLIVLHSTPLTFSDVLSWQRTKQTHA